MKRKYLIVLADYYKDISIGLLKSALKKIPKKNSIKIIYVPGVFEIPVTISKNINRYDAFLALGCVIKGQTPHFDFISQASTNAIMNLSITSKSHSISRSSIPRPSADTSGLFLPNAFRAMIFPA